MQMTKKVLTVKTPQNFKKKKPVKRVKTSKILGEVAREVFQLRI